MRTRTLTSTPRSFLDPAAGGPSFGSFTGPLPRIELGSSLAGRLFRRKKWCWLAIASDEVWISLAVVRMGYASNLFAYAYDLSSRRMLVERTVIGGPTSADVADDPHAAGPLARFEHKKWGLGVTQKATVVLERLAQSSCALRGHLEGLEVDISVDESDAPPSIAAIARLGDSLASATEKRALAKVRGSAVVAGRRISLDGATFGLDYTHGLMPRRTRWRWAFAMGRARDGAPVAFNVVEGFVGEAECAAFRRDGERVFPLAEPRFDFDVEHPERRWRLESEGIDLTFDVGAVHAQKTNLLVVRSRFLQPVGTFRGTLRIDGRDVELDGVPGVVEDQDVVW